jgi:hypothetical protein
MSEDTNTVNPAPETEAKPGCQQVQTIITCYGDKVNSLVEKLLGLVGDHPWEAWLAKFNGWVGTYLPAVIAVSGVLAFITGLVSAIRYDAPLSIVISLIGVLIGTLFSIHLTPKALALSRSFIEKGEAGAMRPELLYILKVVLGLGGIVLAIYFILQFNSEAFVAGLIALVVALLAIIVFSRPAIVGIKADYPTNGVEESITILLFPIKFVLALLTFVVGVGTVGVFVYGIVMLFSSGMEGALFLLGAALLPFILPIVVYFTYLCTAFVLDFYRALVSIPRKLDDVRKALEAK